MNKQIITGEWHELKGKIKQEWGWLTDNDLKVIEGNQEELYGKLCKHFGYSKDDAAKAIQKFKHKVDKNLFH